MVKNPHRIQATIFLLMTVLLCFYFWTASRYPDLNSKAEMAAKGEILEDVLSFRAQVKISETDGTFNQIMKSYYNWIFTNRRGMAFGLILTALLISLFQVHPVFSSSGSFKRTFSGLIFGIPLGLCTNCAAPVLQGFSRSGKKIEGLAVLLTSPTMNIIVLSMCFNLFPLHFFALKFFLTMIFILVILPLLAKGFQLDKKGESGILDVGPEFSGRGPSPVAIGLPLKISSLLLETLKQFFLNLKWIMIKTIPLMLLGGFLGVVLARMLPLTFLAGLPNHFGTYLLLSLVGVFLPVPMAFDVMLSSALYQSGSTPVGLVFILLFTLGIFSVYSFMVVWRNISLNFALAVYGSLTLLGTLSAPFIHFLHEEYLSENQQSFAHLSYQLNQFQAQGSPEEISPESDQYPGKVLPPSLNQRPTLTREKNLAADRKDLQIYSYQMTPPQKAGARPFSRLDGHEIGLPEGFQMSLLDLEEPFYYGRGTGAGDLNQDLWPDIVFGSTKGPQVYLNQKGRFQKLFLPQKEIRDFNVFVVALVDLNNDHWPDLYFTTYNQGNYILYNDQKNFQTSPLTKVPGKKPVLTHSAAFADLNQDGKPDWVEGNFTYGHYIYLDMKSLPNERQKNALVLSERNSDHHKISYMKDYPGETLATLLSDFDNDGILDLGVGNDYHAQDSYFKGLGNGKFKEYNMHEGPIRGIPFNTMSLDTGDVNNDLLLDTFISASVSHGKSNDQKTAISFLKYDESLCQHIKQEKDRKRCRVLSFGVENLNVAGQNRRKINFAACSLLENKRDVSHCLDNQLFMTGLTLQDLHFCDKIRSSLGLRDLCRFITMDRSSQNLNLKVEQKFIGGQSDHHFYLAKGPGQPSLKIEETGHPFPLNTGWTWSTKMGDLNNDGFLDIYLVNGMPIMRNNGNNMFLLNKGKGLFEPKESDFNLFDYFDQTSFSFVDYDRDGDLDIILNSMNGPVRVFRNDQAGNLGLTFRLEDHKGNYEGIGSKITIFHGGNGKGPSHQQMREIKAGNGFMSYDPLEAHFGLGRSKTVEKVKIVWSDGQEHHLNGPFKASHLYVLRRVSQGLPL